MSCLVLLNGALNYTHKHKDACVCVCLSVCLSCLSVYLPVSVYRPVCLFIYLSLLFVCMQQEDILKKGREEVRGEVRRRRYQPKWMGRVKVMRMKGEEKGRGERESG